MRKHIVIISSVNIFYSCIMPHRNVCMLIIIIMVYMSVDVSRSCVRDGDVFVIERKDCCGGVLS